MIRNLVNGAIGGGLATAVYSALLLAGNSAGLLGGRARIARAGQAGRTGPRPGEGLLDTVAQFAFGTASGAVLGLLSTGQRVPVPIGAACGLAVWYAGYQGLVPGIGALPPVPLDRPGRQPVLAAAHLVWGSALAVALNRLRPDRAACAPSPSRVPRLPQRPVTASVAGPVAA